jgi:aromatic-L-amino-acid decarboxylase
MLDPSADEIRDWSNSVIELMADYLGDLRNRPVYRGMSSREIRDRLDASLPAKGSDFDHLLKVFRETIIPFSRQNAHPRMFGYVQSPGTPLAAFADLLASMLNANLTVWRSAPAPVELERLTIDWIRQILGFNAEAGGLFVSGGSLANVCVERDPFFHRQGSSAFGNRAEECAPGRSGWALQNPTGQSHCKNHC